MGLFGWFNEKEEDQTTFEISNDEGEQIVFTVPTKGSNKIRKSLRESGASRDTDHKDYRSNSERTTERRDSGGFRWWGQRDVDESEDREWQGDHEGISELDYEGSDYEPDECGAERWWSSSARTRNENNEDDEASVQPAQRWWSVDEEYKDEPERSGWRLW